MNETRLVHNIWFTRLLFACGLFHLGLLTVSFDFVIYVTLYFIYMACGM